MLEVCLLVPYGTITVVATSKTLVTFSRGDPAVTVGLIVIIIITMMIIIMIIINYDNDNDNNDNDGVSYHGTMTCRG